MAASLEGIDVKITLELQGWFETAVPIVLNNVTVGPGLELNQHFSSRILSDTDGDGDMEPVQGPSGLLEGWLRVDISGNQVFAEFSGQAQPVGIKIRIENLAPEGAAPGSVQMAGEMSGVNIVSAPTYTAATKVLELNWTLLGYQPGTVINQTVYYDNLLEDTPVAGDDHFAVNVGETLAGANLLANDTDLDNLGDFGIVDILSVTHVNGQALDPGAWIDLAAGGQVKVSATGQLEFQENGDFNDLGRDATRTTSFQYTVTDSTGRSDTGDVNIVLTGINSPPTGISWADGSDSNVNQSAGPNGVVGTLVTVDPDASDLHVYTLVSGDGDTDNALFNISGADIRADDASTLAAGAYSVRVRTADPLGWYHEQSFTITVVDDVPPPMPVLSLVDGSVTNVSVSSVSGLAEAYSTVQLFAGGTSLGSTVALANGEWSMTFDALLDGSHTLTATATDSANNTSSLSESVPKLIMPLRCAE